MKRRLHFDFETYSEADIKKVGSDVYAQDPSTEVLMCAYAFDDDDVQLWVPAKGEPLPQELLRAWLDTGTVKFAWNKPFEWSILKHVLGIEIPHNQWRDPMILAMTCSFPGSLDSVGEILGIDEDKRKLSRGKALIRKFCVPRKPTKANPSLRLDHISNPAEWEEFEGYCRNDVVAERTIWEKLRPYDLPVHEWNYWVLDQAINQAGIPINTASVQGACRIYEEAVDGYMAELREITGLENPNSSAQILPWLQARGYPFEDLKKGHVQRAVERCDAEIADSFDDEERVADLQQLKHVMDLRLKSASASVKKYYALQRATSIDGVLRNCFQFAGAQRTWRWAGRIFQPQNLPSPTGFYQIRKTEEIEDYAIRLQEYVRQVRFLHAPDIQLIYGDPIEMLKSLVRPMAHVPDPENELFVDADLNAIENRVLGWIANDRKILEVFEKKRDPYIAFASYMFGLPYEQLYAEYKAGDGKKRKIAKPGTLGCGYMLGPGEEVENRKTGEMEATGLLGYAWNMGVKLTLEESQLSVAVFRETYHQVKKFWYAIEAAALECVRTGKRTECNMLEFDLKGPFLRMRLPSDRHLHYYRPKLEMKRTPWGEMRENLTYEGLNSQGQWVRISTHPGKLTENADQAISRDLIAHGMRLAYREGINVRLHVHDQIVGLTTRAKADRDLQILQECMGVVPAWAPGLPLGSAGHVSPVFLKD